MNLSTISILEYWQRNPISLSHPYVSPAYYGGDQVYSFAFTYDGRVCYVSEFSMPLFHEPEMSLDSISCLKLYRLF